MAFDVRKKMKILLISLMALFLNTNTTLSQEASVPAEIRILQERREEEIGKINNLYVKALERYKLQFTKAGDLENANVVQGLIGEVQDRKDAKSSPRSVREILISSKWNVGDSEKNYKVIFREDGMVLRDDTKQNWWKWKLDGKILWCNWLTSGWYRFDIPDNPESVKWKGTSRGGDKIWIEIAPPE